ncbi:hypothetical protein Celaphus_00009176 [Cervus elaphus hippelaphus]|uniref:Ribonucleoside-diphosphate reductase large subunit n=1 Tax=Cervus elaphus hippelaphus TaxID=46360 RepID=A0A212DI10_CEREH|nr:hypothetical protein Celaphus_00009176 [Cervus elaphus hippelaphus]
MFDKITSRIQKLCYGLNMDFVDPAQITMKVIQGLYSGVTTVELDTLAAETAATLTTKHPDYAILAARIAVSNLHKETKKVFSDVMEDLFNYINPHNGKHSPMVAKSTLDIVLANKDTNGNSNGLVPMLRVYNNTARYVDQGGNKRPGAFAIYLEPWHLDIFEFLDLKKNTGKEEQRARDLFFALWIPDLFMKRVETNQVYSFGKQVVEKVETEHALLEDGRLPPYHPHPVPPASRYEKEGRVRKVIKAQQLWYAIIESQTETGTPYMLYKDSCNRKSNQQNLGTIKCSNLCTEIVEYTSKDEVAVCNLASLALNMYVTSEHTYDFTKLADVTKVIVRNLNKIIDINYYPVPEASLSNKRHRPIGIGVQGLADAFILMRYGIRNSLLIAPMPTASTAQILGNNESIEPYTSNIYTRRVLSGEFQIVNPHLLKDLTERGLWNEEMKNQIIACNGSIQSVPEIPDDLKQLYKTVWEISQKTVLKMAAERGAFIDQSQSLNIHIAEPNYGKLTSMHFYGWKQGLKTGMYYLRTRPAANPIQFTLNKEKLKDKEKVSKEEEKERNTAAMVCSLENRDECLMCGS